MISDSRAEAVRAPKPDDSIVLRHKEVPLAEPKAILGFVEEKKDGKTVPTKTLKDYPVTYMGGATPTLSVRRPFAYAFAALPKVANQSRANTASSSSD